MNLIERVKRAYKQIGLRPCKGHFRNKETGACCPMAAIAISKQPSLKEDGRSTLYCLVAEACLGKDSNWLEGFLAGFDGQSEDDIDKSQRHGFRAGRAVSKALFSKRKAA